MIKYYFMIYFILIMSVVNTKPIYNQKQLRSILYNHSKITKGFPTILGIHFYNNKEGKVLQLEFETESINTEIIILAMNSLAKVGQFSKTPLNDFIVINHYNDSDIPISYKSNADCAINYFVKNHISKKNWMKDCLSNSITQKETKNWLDLNLGE